MSQVVLVVDDDPIIRNLIREILQELDMRVEEASNGVEALILFQTRGPQYFCAAILDLMIPQMNGADLVKQLKALNPNLITILCSGLPHILVGRGKENNHGFNAIINKPFTIEQFKTVFLRTLMDA